MLAFIYWAEPCSLNEYGVKSFKTQSSKQFIDVSVVERNVGFIRKGSCTCVVDPTFDNIV